MGRRRMRLPKRWTTWRPRIYGADIRIHVSAWLLIGIIALSTLKTPLVALAAICAYLGLVLLHEFGHAYFAHRLGYAVHEIEIGAFHGHCLHETHGDERDDAIIAWGGVAAQLALALPIIALDLSLSLRGEPVVGGMIKILGYYSVILAVINLIPVAPLDGARAWRLPRILHEERRRRRPKPTAAAKPRPKATTTRDAGEKVVKGPWKNR